MNVVYDSLVGKRETNQDYLDFYSNQSDQSIAILCDGMGGHKAGDVASEMAVTQLGNQWTKTSFTRVSEAKRWLRIKINEENNRIFKASNTYDDLFGMGTTIVLAVFIGDQILFANVGDSRAYIYENKEVELVTEDHSFANQLYLQGEISLKEARNHTQKHTLTRSLGVSNEVEVDFFIIPRANIEHIFLCSDGLSNTLSTDEMILTLMADVPLEEKAQTMIQNAYKNGSKDNISILLFDLKKVMEGGE